MPSPETKMHVIIDTDPGLDDAVAVLFALASGRFEVLGLTTVAGNIGLDRTTRNAGSLLTVVGRSDIPVVAGASTAMLRENIDAIVIHGDDGLRGITLPAPSTPATVGAVDWMAKMLLDSPAGTIDILALGPLTNVARLVNDHPAAAARIGRIIAMGGTIDDPGNAGPASEFNFASDPEATAIVLRSDVRVTIVPLDVTRRVRADLPYMESLRTTEAGIAAADLLIAYLQDGKTSRPLHDPCVMLLAVAPELFETEVYRLSVNLGDDPDAGALTRSGNGTLVTVAMRVNVPGVLELLASGFR
jgi:purine nucleosidase